LPTDPIKRWENEGGSIAPPPVDGSQMPSVVETRDEQEEIRAEDEDARASSKEAKPARREVS
jgi:hypothetical protein